MISMKIENQMADKHKLVSSKLLDVKEKKATNSL